MRLNRLVVVALLSVAPLLSASAAKSKAPKCPQGQTLAAGKCVAACPAEGNFADPDACECPAGYGKILLGSGGGQCSRLRCPTATEMAASRDCDCPQGYEKKPLKKGKVRCEIRQTQGG